MSKLSVKQRLIVRIEEKAADPDVHHADRWAWRQMAKGLRARGSGPLPFWARELAREWGISK